MFQYKWLLLGLPAIFLLKPKSAGAAVSENLSTQKYDALFKKYGLKYGVNWHWLKAIAMNESNLGRAPSVAEGLKNPFNIEGSKSSDGLSWGLMQVTIKTAKSLDPTATEVKLNNPEYSIDLASKLTAQHMKMFNSKDKRYVESVIKSYNQGPTHTKNEMNGVNSNPTWKLHVNEYWARFQRNLQKIENGEV